MGRDKVAEDFIIPAPKGAAEVSARVIGIVENQAPTRALTRTLAVRNGIVEPDEGAGCRAMRGDRASSGIGPDGQRLCERLSLQGPDGHGLDRGGMMPTRSSSSAPTAT